MAVGFAQNKRNTFIYITRLRIACLPFVASSVLMIISLERIIYKMFTKVLTCCGLGIPACEGIALLKFVCLK